MICENCAKMREKERNYTIYLGYTYSFYSYPLIYLLLFALSTFITRCDTINISVSQVTNFI